MVAFSFAVETRRPLVVGIAIAAFDQHVVALQEIVSKAGASVLPR